MKRFTTQLACVMTALGLAALGMTAQAQAGDMLVTPQWLVTHVHDPDLVVLHVGDKGDYRAKHIPGARYVELGDISVNSGGLSLQMPAPADLKARLERLGISDRSRIVVYYAGDSVAAATRVVFTLYAAGLGDQVSLLDGGLGHWQGPVSATAAAGTTGHLSDLNMLPVVADQAFVKAHMAAPGYDIIDARDGVFYDGVEAGGPMMHMKKGHIPGAKSVPYTSFSHDDLTEATPQEIRAIFATAGVKPGEHLIVYCHIGMQATAVLFAAREVGIDAVLYDGSFEDWAIHDQPVTTGR